MADEKLGKRFRVCFDGPVPTDAAGHRFEGAVGYCVQVVSGTRGLVSVPVLTLQFGGIGGEMETFFLDDLVSVSDFIPLTDPPFPIAERGFGWQLRQKPTEG